MPGPGRRSARCSGRAGRRDEGRSWQRVGPPRRCRHRGAVGRERRGGHPRLAERPHRRRSTDGRRLRIREQHRAAQRDLGGGRRRAPSTTTVPDATTLTIIATERGARQDEPHEARHDGQHRRGARDQPVPHARGRRSGDRHVHQSPEAGRVVDGARSRRRRRGRRRDPPAWSRRPACPAGPPCATCSQSARRDGGAAVDDGLFRQPT